MKKKSKVLIHSLVFSPDGVSTAYLYNDIALALKREGYEVTVLSTTPHYNVLSEALKKQPLTKRALGLYYTSSFNGIQVIHVPQKKFKHPFLRVSGFAYWHLLSFLIGLIEKKVDIIISPSPPLTIGLVNILLGKLKGSKVIYNVQEIYPDFLIEQGGLRSKIVIAILKWIERILYNKSDAVTTIDTVFYKTILPRFKDGDKLHIIPNFVDTRIYKPLDKENLEINKGLFPSNPSTLKLMYAGNIGHAQDWELLIAIAIRMRHEPVEFFIIGEGILKKKIRQEIEKLNLTNIYLLPYQPRENMASLIAYSDIQFIFMTPGMEKHGFPSKIYTIMACAKPIIVSSGKNTSLYNFLQNKECAFCITENEIDRKVDEIERTLKSTNKSNLKIKGKSGCEEIRAKFSSDIVTQKYVKLIDKILGSDQI